MSTLTLPPVAKSFYTLCKKCEGERYHRVLAHKTSTTAKIECEICKSVKTYSLPKTGSDAPSARRLSGAAATGAAKKAAASARSHSGQYEIFTSNKMNETAVPYSIKGSFKESQKINHVKFGIGFVTKTYDEKIDVIFVDEVRSLMQNRK
ncbi:hypothetical protein CIK05_06470 [Bdellovibrio sp. qaytius]|nr:hypothetical protein CIK05_06470 [Bdellovibrio sp. qaytius]